MKHYVLGLIFNQRQDKILLIKKKRPDWMKGRWNGIGGKIDNNENPTVAMQRETTEETDLFYSWEHFLTFVCPGGTVFVFRAFSHYQGGVIEFTQKEDETLKTFSLSCLPIHIMSNLKWIIPVALSNIEFPIMLHQKTLGI
jgi:8-oxo-dGTP diphosphatase